MTLMPNLELKGVLVAVCTPFDRESKLDLEAYTAHLRWLAKQGVNGFVACGTTGEGPTLNKSERTAILKRTKEIAKEYSLKAIAGCGTNSTPTSLELIHEAKELGFDATLVVTPYYNKPTQAGLLAHYFHLADHGGLPILLYQVPSRTGVSLSGETVTELMKHPSIVGIKEASGHYSQWLALSQSVDWKGKFFLSGDDDSFAPILALGGTGIISASANFAPRPFVELFEAASVENWKRAFQLQKQLFPLVRALFSETNPGPLKYLLGQSRQFNYPPYLRLPLVSVTAQTERVIQEAVENARSHFDL